MNRLISLFLFLPFSVCAHNVGFGKANIQATLDGNISLSLEFDLAAWSVAVDPARLTLEDVGRLAALSPVEFAETLEAARRRLNSECLFLPAEGLRFELPLAEQIRTAFQVGLISRVMPSNFLVTATCHLPPDKHSFCVRFPPLIGAIALTFRVGDRTLVQQLLLPGEQSPPCAVAQSAPAETMTRGKAAMRYSFFGFTHILPKGLDHILFVLGLFLLSPKLKPLLWQVTAFTIAHSLTLALSLYGIFSLPSRVVEPMIAASITFVAIENLFTSRLRPWRPLVVFGFGLVHGLGFAGELTELGLPRNQFVTALISFNVGVECGQLAVLGLATLAVGWFFRAKWYRTGVVIPASCLIALVGGYWTLQRLLA